MLRPAMPSEPTPTPGPMPGPMPGRALGTTRAWFAAFGALMGGRALGLALLPMLLVRAPALLLLLSPMLAHLVLAQPLLEPLPYFAAALAGSILQGAIAYQFGLALGDKARIWLEGRGAATHPATTWTLAWMKRAAPLVLLTLAGPPVCALAGVARVRPVVVYPIMVLAQVIWVGACWLFGSAVPEQLAQIHTFVETHVVELSIVAGIWVGGTWLWKRHRRQRAATL
jgi:membrane protein YqaA with SNARE-associated domain